MSPTHRSTTARWRTFKGLIVCFAFAAMAVAILLAERPLTAWCRRGCPAPRVLTGLVGDEAARWLLGSAFIAIALVCLRLALRPRAA